MIYLRVGLAFLGSLLIVFPGIRIYWEFLSWHVMSVIQQRPPFIVQFDTNREDPRISWRVEAFVICLGVACVFAACILK